MTQIPDAPDLATLVGDEQFIARGATGDVNFTTDQMADFANDSLTPAETLAKVIASSPQTNGLNANLLQGLVATYFTNASNLASGTVPNARLPQGQHSHSWASGGAYPNAGQLSAYLKLGEVIAGGPKIMIQWGWTQFLPENTTRLIAFNQPFSAGWSNDNAPWVGIFPECRSSEWPSIGTGAINVELDIRAHNTSLTNFYCSVIRTAGALGDYVRGNWVAIGYYA